jgi:hypothetical protein
MKSSCGKSLAVELSREREHLWRKQRVEKMDQASACCCTKDTKSVPCPWIQNRGRPGDWKIRCEPKTETRSAAEVKTKIAACELSWRNSLESESKTLRAQENQRPWRQKTRARGSRSSRCVEQKRRPAASLRRKKNGICSPQTESRENEVKPKRK